MNRTLYIVDGYNVLHFMFRGAEKEEIFARRDWLADRLAELRRAARRARSSSCSTARSAQYQQRAHQGRAVEVVFAGGRFTADTLIARRIAGQPADVEVVVVSADQEVQRTASSAGVSRMTPPELARGALRRRPITGRLLTLPQTLLECPHGLRIK